MPTLNCDEVVRLVCAQVLERSEYKLHDAQKHLVTEIDHHELVLLAKPGYVITEVPRGKCMVHIRLTVRTSFARRLLNHARVGTAAVLANHGISKLQTSVGAMRWRPRLDRADGGLPGRSYKRLVVDLGSQGVGADPEVWDLHRSAMEAKRAEDLKSLIGQTVSA